jgi:hypothetical protein
MIMHRANLATALPSYSVRDGAGDMSIHRYVTSHVNDVQQLSVTVSKHLTVLKDGRLKWQWKPQDVDTRTIPDNARHVLHYMIRDHFSGAFYAEVSSSTDFLDIADFLYRAWTDKTVSRFKGLPLALTVPATVIRMFPRLPNLLHYYDIESIKATSGFQSGVRDVRTWEVAVRCRFWEHPYAELREAAPALSNQLCENRSGRNGSKWHCWETISDSCLMPKSHDECIAAYRDHQR